MQSKQVKEAPRHWPRCGSSFFLVKTSPQFWIGEGQISFDVSAFIPNQGMAGVRTSQEKDTIVSLTVYSTFGRIPDVDRASNGLLR